jgi:hypothetical protein
VRTCAPTSGCTDEWWSIADAPYDALRRWYADHLGWAAPWRALRSCLEGLDSGRAGGDEPGDYRWIDATTSLDLQLRDGRVLVRRQPAGDMACE